MFANLLRKGASRDSGSALIAALGVAIVGMAFSVIVVMVAINVTNDAARDRVRTVEVHAAEAGLDSTFRVLEESTPCENTMPIGHGSDAVDVTVAIQYFDATTPSVPLICSEGLLSGIPVRAVLTSTALPANDMPGIVPERRMRATVNLVPLAVPKLGVAIFSGGTMTVANSGTISSLDPTQHARIWVENSNFQCSNSSVIDADLIVTDGTATFSQTCRVTGSAWVWGNTSSGGNPSPNRVGGNLVVYNGSLTNENGKKQVYGGSVSVRGTITNAYTAGGATCSSNVGSPCGTLPLYVKRGLPVVTYAPSDWPSSFVAKPSGIGTGAAGTFAGDVINGGVNGTPLLTGSKATAFAANPCVLNNQIKDPINFTHTDSIYDLRACGPLTASQTITFVIYADTAFFSDGFNATNSFTIRSGDGLPHNVWFITPTGSNWSSDTAAPGNINMSQTSDIIAPIHVFLFTPHALNFANTQNMVGQAYAKTVHGNNSLAFQYIGMGIPGVDLGESSTSTAPSGYSVEIVSKREITN